MKLKISAAGEHKGDENLVPLINIVFLLLIFFLVAGSMAPNMQKGVEPAVLMNAEASELPPGALFVTRNGVLMHDGAEVHLGAPGALEGLSRTEPLPVLADHRLSAKEMIRISHELRQAGFENITLITTRSGGA